MKTFYEHFPIEIAYTLQKLCRQLGTGDSGVSFYDRHDLLVRVKNAPSLAALVGKPVLVCYNMTKRAKDSPQRRPLVTLIQIQSPLLKPAVNSHEEFISWLLNEVVKDARCSC